jgi:hypothetical protein
MQQAEFIGAQVERLPVPPRLQGCEIDQQRAQLEPFVDARLRTAPFFVDARLNLDG